MTNYLEISDCFNDIYDCRYPTFALGELTSDSIAKVSQGHKKFIVFEGREVLHDDAKPSINNAVNDAVKKLLSYLPADSELTMVFDITASLQLKPDTFPNNVKIEFMPFWLVFNHCAHLYHNQVSREEYNFDSGKFLYMPGKVNKTHRVAVLQAMYRNRWFKPKIATWSTNFSSIPKTGKYHDQVSDILRLWDSNQNFITTIEEFIVYDNQLDYDLSKHIDQNHFHITGIPYDVSIYNDVGFDVVSETNFSGRDHEHLGIAWLTEKTYRPIYNTMPFIHICESANDTLKSLGFETYEELYGIDKFSDPITRDFYMQFTRAVKNLKERIALKDSELTRKALHNKQHSITLANDYIDRYNDIVSNFSELMVLKRAHPNCLHIND